MAFATVSGGFVHTCAIRVDGAPWCWGLNVLGQVGDGTTTDRWTPVPVINANAAPVPAVGPWMIALLVLLLGAVGLAGRKIAAVVR